MAMSSHTQQAWAAGIAGLLEGYLQAKNAKKAEDKADRRFYETLAAKRLEDQQAEQWKRTQFALDQEKAINQIAGMGREQFFTDPRTGQVTNQAPVMNPADIEAAQKRVRALLPGAQYGYTPNAPLLGLDAGPQQPMTNESTVVPSGVFPGLSAGAPAPAETLTVNPVPSTPETLRQFPRPGTGVKSTGKGGAGDAGGPPPAQVKDFAKELAGYEEQATEGELITADLEKLSGLNADSYGGALGGATTKLKTFFNTKGDPKLTNTLTVVNSLKGLVSKVLKSTFGGQLSEGEREYLNEVYGAAANYSQEQREIAMRKVKELISSKIVARKDKVDSLGRTYGMEPKYKARTGATGVAPQTTQPGAPNQAPVIRLIRGPDGKLQEAK